MKSGLLIILLLVGSGAVAQKRFSEGSIDFVVETTANGIRDEEKLTGNCLYKGAHYRSSLSAAMGTSTTIFDSREGIGAVYHDFGSQRLMILLNREQWIDKNSLLKNKAVAFEPSADTAMILGYACQKATTRLADSSLLEVFYTTELLPENTDTEWQFPQLNGMVLSLLLQKKDITVHFRAIGLNLDPVPIQKFDIPTSGYRMLDYWESKKLK